MTILFMVLTGIILVAVGGYYAFPQKVGRFLVSLARKKAGLTKKAVLLGDHTLIYLEGGSGAETILLLHGFAGNKDHWLGIAPYLKDYHIVILDLPGHGESSKLGQAKYNTSQQIDRLHQFARQMQFGKFHILGNSMGGLFSGAYAVRYLCLNSGLKITRQCSSRIAGTFPCSRSRGKPRMLIWSFCRAWTNRGLIFQSSAPASSSLCAALSLKNRDD